MNGPDGPRAAGNAAPQAGGGEHGKRAGRDRHTGHARTGLLLMVLGAAFALRQLGASGLLFELLWLAAIFAAASWTYRLIERRSTSAPAKTRSRTLVFLLAAFGLFAVITLDRLAGPAFLGTVALYFWLRYSSPSVGRSRATGLAIVAGAVSTVALVAAVSELFPRWDSGAIFFLGMTATFTFVYLLPRERGGARWALWPALAWAALTLLVNDPTGTFTRWALPLTLIGVGVALLGYTRGRR